MRARTVTERKILAINVKNYYSSHPEVIENRRIKNIGNKFGLLNRLEVNRAKISRGTILALSKTENKAKVQIGNSSEARRIKLREAQRRRYDRDPIAYSNHMREIGLMATITEKNTKIELKAKEQLLQANIEFELQKRLIGRTRADIFILPNIVIYLDGCYWHKCPIHYNKERISRRTSSLTKCRETEFINRQQLRDQGYHVIEIWEHDINKPNFDIREYIKV